MMLNIGKNKNKDNFNNSMMEKVSKPIINIIKNTSKNSNERSILSLIINKEKRRNSIATTDTIIIEPERLEYNLKDIEKFDEFNNSLDDISEFDLENETNENKSEFNSSEEDNDESIEGEIIIKNQKITENKKYDSEYEIELENEFEKIMNSINNNKI